MDAVDAVQEAFATLLGLPQARELSLDNESAAQLMAVIVRNAARNMRRRHHRQRSHDRLEEDVLATELPDVETLISAAEEHVALLGCVGQLGRIQRRVVTLRVLEELTPEDTARELDLTSGNVAVLLHRAKKALYDCIELGRDDD